MAGFLGLVDLFAGRHFDREVIVLCVRWYLRFKLSYRDLVEMMAERGLSIVHTTIMRWVRRYVPEFERRWNRFARDEGPLDGCRTFLEFFNARAAQFQRKPLRAYLSVRCSNAFTLSMTSVFTAAPAPSKAGSSIRHEPNRVKSFHQADP
jgi:hypothetical protein